MSEQPEMMPPFDGREVNPPPAPRTLGPAELIQIDLDHPLGGYQGVKDAIRSQGNLVAAIDAGKKRFFIIDARDAKSKQDFLIVDETFSIVERIGFKSFDETTSIVIGRAHHDDCFSYTPHVSREHFAVTSLGGQLYIENLRPTNKTTVTAHLVSSVKPCGYQPRYLVDDLSTNTISMRLAAHPNFGEQDGVAPYGYYLNHPVIGRTSTSVDGGVYLGGSAREAIVVDGKSETMKKVYESVLADLPPLSEHDGLLPLRALLLKVMHDVQITLPYDELAADEISAKHQDDKLIGLSTYVKERAGVCRHQGLLAAYIIERLINDGQMLGTVGVERNTVTEMGGSHAWAIFRPMRNVAEPSIVVDPTHSFVGTKARARTENRWEYYLNTDD